MSMGASHCVHGADKDVTYTQLQNRKMARPPADVAADSARLKLWQKEQSDPEAKANKAMVIVEARGCGNTMIYSCGYAALPASGSSQWVCMKQDYPHGVAKW